MTIQPRLFEHEAHSALGHLEARFRKCVESAEATWNQACAAAPRLRKAARGRGRNSVFNELVADAAREEFEHEAEVDVCEQYGTVRLHVRGDLDIGFKKVDKRGRCSAYPTPRRRRYNHQMTLPDWSDPLPEAIRLHVGIEWDAAGTEVIDVYMTYPYQRESLWKYPLDHEAAHGAAVNVAAAAPAPKKARFKSKVAKPDEAAKKAE
jgi:hypothetical protein